MFFFHIGLFYNIHTSCFFFPTVTHSNATKTLTEISIFCVRLIQHIANDNNNNNNGNSKAEITKKLTDVYLDLIKKFYTSK